MLILAPVEFAPAPPNASSSSLRSGGRVVRGGSTHGETTEHEGMSGVASLEAELNAARQAILADEFAAQGAYTYGATIKNGVAMGGATGVQGVGQPGGTPGIAAFGTPGMRGTGTPAGMRMGTGGNGVRMTDEDEEEEDDDDDGEDDDDVDDDDDDDDDDDNDSVVEDEL